MVSLFSLVWIRFSMKQVRKRIFKKHRKSLAVRQKRTMADLCTGFEPQNYLKDRCRKCFRPKEKHEDEENANTLTKKERRKSWKDRISENGGPEEVSQSDDAEIMSVSSYLSATSKGFSSVKSQESMNDTKSMVTAMSGSIEEEERAMTPTEEDQTSMLSLKDEVAQLRESNRQLKEELLQKKSYRSNDENETALVKMLQDRLNEAENSIQDYRDENSVLKMELRDHQETTYANSDKKLTEKIKTTEGLCDDLMEENEQLKRENSELQHEIEEMQDQYREEEIEEFRELQRELEQNAKNCRVLQFKLRKAERMKEQVDTEKYQLQTKLNDLLAGVSDGIQVSLRSDGARVKELESELRIAKEVSVRLHTELEQSEEKRYKLEDEVFYMKEKVRELQTQSKWREARNRTDTAVKRLSAELTAPPTMPEGEGNKELRDAIEREIDIREQLKYSEEDLKRTQTRLQEMESENEVLLKKLAKSSKLRPPMVRSASEGNAHLQLELAEHEVEHLNSKVERLEKTNDHLNKKILELETDFTKRTEAALQLCGGEFKMTVEMEKDMTRMITTISDLERRNHELEQRVKTAEARSTTSNCIVSPELRAEQDRRQTLQSEVTELKQLMLKGDNQKLIQLAIKVEQLNSQLSMSNDRCNNLHKKLAKDGDGAKYMDELKSKIEILERQVSEKKAVATIQDLQNKDKENHGDEIEQVCEVLASIESQTGRLSKQIEKIDLAQKDERRRSLSKDSGAAILAEVANLMMELKKVHKLMDNIKISNPSLLSRRSPKPEIVNVNSGVCGKCKENEKTIEEQQNEIIFYKKKNKDLTNQVLQTEDRWTIEIEKQRQIFENEIKSLGIRISDSKRQLEEQSQLIEAKSLNLVEKSRALEELEDRAKRLQRELDEQKKDLQELETDKKNVKEFEIKYNKLESIFETEREKMNGERSRSKTEIQALKKIADDAEELLKKTSDDNQKRESGWKTEKAALDREVTSLKKQLAAFRNGDDDHHERASSHESDKQDTSKLSRTESDKIHVIDLKKQIALLEKKNADIDARLEDIKISKAELQDELNRTKQGWTKEKEAFQHKTRQTEKIRTVEMDALQQKFSSRMRIMEDTNKSLHSQLVLARRERDTHKEGLNNYEKKMLDEKKAVEQKLKEYTEAVEKAKTQQRRIVELETELERMNTDLRLTKEARKADLILHNMERPRTSNKKLSEEDKKSVEGIQQQYRECEKFYAKEVDRLNEKIKEMSLQSQQQKVDMTKTMRELRETIRVLEIDQRNLSQKKDSQLAARELLESETERLQQVVHMTELQKLTRKYRLSSIIDQLQYVTDPVRRGAAGGEHSDGMRYIISQLIAIRDEDTQNIDDRCGSAQASIAERIGYAPSLSECGDATYDNISQSSFSVRSVTSMPVRGTVRWSSNQATVTGTVASPPPKPKNNHPARLEHSRTTEDDQEEGAGEYSSPTRNRSTAGFPTKRSFSTENPGGFDRYGRSLTKKSAYPDPPPSFILNGGSSVDSEKIIEYDKDGRIHYVPKSLARTTSFDRRSEMTADDSEEPSHSRMGSTGTNILYRIRREELARGGQPSVKLMAKAFEAIDEPMADKRGFFGMRKSRSVETTQDRSKKKETIASSSSMLKHSVSQMDDSGGSTASSVYGTMPRGGRNPFKSMGSKLVERVRRSLSRSSRQDKELSEQRELKEESPKKDKGSSSPKKTKKKSAESKARKSVTTAISNGNYS